MLVFNQPHRPTQPGYPSVSRHNEYWLWFWPLLGKNIESCVIVGPVTRNADIPACSRLKALAVNIVGHSDDMGRMLA